MYSEMIFAGFGGQGIMTIGQIIAYSGMGEGKAVAWIPSYGPEMRGGTANCTVVVTDEPQVGAPLTAHPDWVIAMNNPSFAKFEPMIKPGGVMVYNESLISNLIYTSSFIPNHNLIKDYNKDINVRNPLDETKVYNKKYIKDAWVQIITAEPSVVYNETLYVGSPVVIRMEYDYDIEVPEDYYNSQKKNGRTCRIKYSLDYDYLDAFIYQ